MYGLVMLSVRDLVLAKFGTKAWKKICSAAGVPDVYVINQSYDDKVIYSIVGAASKVLSVSVPELLEVAGYWFTVYLKKTEYAKLLQMAGPTFPLALRNITQLHSAHIRQYFPHLAMPIVRCTFESDNVARVQYAPTRESRTGLGTLLVGVIKGWAEHDYGIRYISITQEKSRDKGAPFDEYLVVWDPTTDSGSETSDSDSAPSSARDRAPEPQLVVAPTHSQFIALFPFHIAFDEALLVLQIAPSMRKLVPTASVGKRFDKIFNVMLTGGVSAPADWKFRDAKDWEYEMVTIQLAQSAAEPGKPRPQLKGQFLTMREPVKCVIFVGSPVIRDINEAQKLGLSLSDFALHDPNKDAIFMTDARSLSDAAAAAKKHKSRSKKEKKEKKDKKEKSSAPGSSSGSGGLLETLLGSKLKPVMSSLAAIHPSSSGSSQNLSANNNPPVSPLSRSNTTVQLDAEARDLPAPPIPPKVLQGLMGMCPVVGSVSPSPTARLPDDPVHKRLVAPHAASPPPAPLFASRAAGQLCDFLIEDSWNKFDLSLTLLRHASAQIKDRKVPDQLLPALIQFFDARGTTMDFIRTALDQELALAQQASEDTGYLRSNELPARICTAYFQLHGGSAFLRSVLQPLIATIESSSSDTPDAKLMTSVITQLFTAVNSSLHNGTFPRPVWQVLSYVYQSGLAACLRRPLEGVASLLFLRYLHVALVAPDHFSVTTRPLSVPAQRASIQIAKQAQLVVNACLQSERLPTPVAAEHQQLVEAILIRLSDVRSFNSYSMNPSLVEGAYEQMTRATLQSSIGTIRDFLLEHTETFLDLAPKNSSLRRVILSLTRVALADIAS